MRVLTNSGQKKLLAKKDELERKIDDLVELAHNLSTSENMEDSSDYSNAIEEKMRLQGEISEIDFMLKEAQVMKKKSFEKVDIGCVIRLATRKMNYIFQLVDSVEANPTEGKLSVDSPLGSKVIGKNTGENITLMTPTGPLEYTILEVI